MPDRDTTFGRALRRLRTARGLTQADLAEAAGTSPWYVSQLERGERSPGIEIATALCRALGVRLLIVDGTAQLPLS